MGTPAEVSMVWAVWLVRIAYSSAGLVKTWALAGAVHAAQRTTLAMARTKAERGMK
jgi:hypothetical protein